MGYLYFFTPTVQEFSTEEVEDLGKNCMGLHGCLLADPNVGL